MEKSHEQYANWKAPEESLGEKSDKQKRWQELTTEIEQITDGLGKGIDEGIKKSIIAMKAYEFSPDQSCEGHLEGDHGLPYPWVRIYASEPEGWKESEAKQKEWRMENLKEQQKMMNLLAEFYNNRSVALDARLVFDGIGAFGGFNIQSMGAETIELLSKEEQAEKYKLYKQEMDDFTSFLKSRFLQN